LLFFHLLLLISGVFCLMAGAELLVKKASVLAGRFHINPFFVGVVLLGMGTSAPEWAVSAISSMKGLSNLAVANIFGSNIFNILLVMGLILLNPLSRDKVKRIKNDILFLFLSGFTLVPIMRDHFLSRLDAFFLTLIFLAYIVFSLFTARQTSPEPTTKPNKNQPLLTEVFIIILGFALLIGGSHLTVTGAAGLGQKWGMSERLIGILIVSVGTSLPELFASLAAIMRGHKDMAVGNIIGSNIFNTFAIFSTSAWILPVSLDSKMWQIDLPVLFLIHTFLLLILFCHQVRWFQKALPYIFFGGYICYLAILLFTLN